ncbi:DUF3137 domain-containing protein [Paenibacillus paeoniae]|uniref:DUF3137 domain-containing protein n=1 Tax=Paenibacillus paeoniae TaxID=2292705 RepID=A0A371P7W8_9BACL|nr:DUF3137 domain-containing protein [Paenibacillus paeoniae]REK71556.1 DUF3137 domain-containing protein [Paenibacillus paeoniae]
MLPSYEIASSNINLPYEKLNKTKAESNKKWIRTVAVFLVSTVILVATFLNVEYSLLTIFVIGIWILSIWYSVRVFIKGRAVYNAELKHAVVGALADNMLKFAKLPFESEQYEKYCHYEHDARISDEWIDASELFMLEDRRVAGEDYFEGKYGLTEFYMSELKITTKEIIDSEGYSSTGTKVAFNGVLFIADFKKDFTGLTVIETNYIKTNSAVGGFFAKMLQNEATTTSKRANHVIEFENAEFNRHFTVRTDNEMNARNILSPAFMQHLLDFCKSYPNPIMISFHHSYMFVAVWSHKNFIDSGLKKKHGEYDLRNVYEEMAVFFRIIEKFELNTKVWSEE